jgi:hypothetical protein
VKSEEGDWQKLDQWLDELRTSVGHSAAPGLLFRGQGNSGWALETTLERNGQKNMSVAAYYRLITLMGPAVNAFTAVSAPAYDPSLLKGFSDKESLFELDRFPSGPHFEYMAYLRHHGFPSPLLDWSRSPYVAAFFAFRNANPQNEARSIYAYCESLDGCKGGAVGEHMIRTLGPYVRTHARHFLQQSAYTVCESLDANDNWQYDSHQKVFENARPGQDFLWRFDISSTERVKVLRRLDEFNLNAYSLFDSEEALLETLWVREQIFSSQVTQVSLLEPGIDSTIQSTHAPA